MAADLLLEEDGWVRSSRRRSTMRGALLALLCVAGLWPLALLTGGPGKRRHKEEYLGEETRNKPGG